MTLYLLENHYNYLFRFFFFIRFSMSISSFQALPEISRPYSFGIMAWRIALTRPTDVPVLISRGLLPSFLFQLCVPFSKLSVLSFEELLARGKHEGFLRSFKFLQILKSAGRTKWTRTTDLVLIRHAL